MKSELACPRSHAISASDKVPDILICTQRTLYFRPLRDTSVTEKPLWLSCQEREKGSGRSQENKGEERSGDHFFFFFSSRAVQNIWQIRNVPKQGTHKKLS